MGGFSPVESNARCCLRESLTTLPASDAMGLDSRESGWLVWLVESVQKALRQFKSSQACSKFKFKSIMIRPIMSVGMDSHCWTSDKSLESTVTVTVVYAYADTNTTPHYTCSTLHSLHSPHFMSL